MSELAPTWAFRAEAVDGRADPHLSVGVHVRALPNPTLGLPATPLLVGRSVLSPHQSQEWGRRPEIRWVDSTGAVLTAPFDVRAGRPVTGYLPSKDCLWIQLLAQLTTGSRGLMFEALTNTEHGVGVVLRRSRDPYVLAGHEIELVRVSGEGRLLGVRWLAQEDALRLATPEPWQIWSLPVEPAPRYTPTPNAIAEARQRVLRGAPRRQPMYAAASAVDPSTAAAAAPNDALARINAIMPELSSRLRRLLRELHIPTWAVTEAHRIDGAEGSMQIPIEPHLLASALDPDAGHWLGFGDVDPTPADNGSIVIYSVRGLWRWQGLANRWHEFLVPRLARHLRPSRRAALEHFPELVERRLAPSLEGPYLDLTALGVAVVALPPDPPSPPNVDGLDDHGWLPEPPPPHVRRAVQLNARGFVPSALAALVAIDARGTRTLNPVARRGRLAPGEPVAGPLLPLLVTSPSVGRAPGEGRFGDRDAPEGPVQYRLAQSDWFGRWSGWSSGAILGKARTPPLPPALEVLYLPPEFAAGPLPNEAASGTLLVRVPLPETASLPAGGHPLERLELFLSIDGAAPTTTSYALGTLTGAVIEPHDPPEHDMLVVRLAGPSIPRAGARTARLTARWVDHGNLVSVESAPAAQRLLDPRPAASPAVPTELLYTARPDATGAARVELTWPSVPGTRYRVFASTETTLLMALANANKHDIAEEIASAAAGAPRAMAFRRHQHHFGWDAFESVTAASVVAVGASITFVHRVSGSLQVLCLYRVIGEGESGALAEISEADLIAVAVPNLGPPPPPLVALEREPADHENDGVALRVKVPFGRAAPVAWRLRRASVPVTEPLRMQIVDSGPISEPTRTSEGLVFGVRDRAPLRRWRQYRWSVEVQAGRPEGAPASGVTPPGEWSAGSSLVTLFVIPKAAPAAATSVTAASVAGGVQLTITHPEADQLIGTAVGTFRFEIVRASRNRRPRTVDLLVQRSTGNAFVALDPEISPDSIWSVRVIDPIGRVSEAVLSNRV